MLRQTLLAGVATFAFAANANAHITEIRIDAVEPFAEGHSFGPAGAYERVRGIANSIRSRRTMPSSSISTRRR
jgi:hypothetical protein